jgi:hypothetical protein
MERKNLGNLMILLGLLFFVGSYFTYIISTFIFSVGISIVSYIIVLFINLGAIHVIVIGAYWAKKSKDYWFMLIGLILLITAMFLGALEILFMQAGLSPTVPYYIVIALIIMGIFCIVAGGLMQSKGK